MVTNPRRKPEKNDERQKGFLHGARKRAPKMYFLTLNRTAPCARAHNELFNSLHQISSTFIYLKICLLGFVPSIPLLVIGYLFYAALKKACVSQCETMNRPDNHTKEAFTDCSLVTLNCTAKTILQDTSTFRAGSLFSSSCPLTVRVKTLPVSSVGVLHLAEIYCLLVDSFA